MPRFMRSYWKALRGQANVKLLFVICLLIVASLGGIIVHHNAMADTGPQCNGHEPGAGPCLLHPDEGDGGGEECTPGVEEITCTLLNLENIQLDFTIPAGETVILPDSTELNSTQSITNRDIVTCDPYTHTNETIYGDVNPGNGQLWPISWSPDEPQSPFAPFHERGTYKFVAQAADPCGTSYLSAGQATVTVLPYLTVEFTPDTIMENAGTDAAVVEIRRWSGDETVDLVVTLSVDIEGDISFPATVTIPAGQATSAAIAAIDDNWAGGSHMITMIAEAENYFPGQGALTVLNDDGEATLALSIDKESIWEDEGIEAAWGTVIRDSEPNVPLEVTLWPYVYGEIGHPATVTIPLGQMTATFPIDALLDYVVDGDTEVTLVAEAYGHEDGQASILVKDVDNRAFSLQVSPTVVGESAGPGAVMATLSRSLSTIDEIITVTLASSDTTEATCPVSIDFTSGQTVATFLIDIIDDAIVDRNQTVTLQATSSTYAPAQADLTVMDDEEAALYLAISPSVIQESSGAGAATGTVTRNHTFGSLSVTISSNLTGVISYPTSVIIPDGDTSASFTIDAIQDTTARPSVDFSFLASAPRHTSATAPATYVDDDVFVDIAADCDGDGVISLPGYNAGEISNTSSLPPVAIHGVSIMSSSASVMSVNLEGGNVDDSMEYPLGVVFGYNIKDYQDDDNLDGDYDYNARTPFSDGGTEAIWITVPEPADEQAVAIFGVQNGKSGPYSMFVRKKGETTYWQGGFDVYEKFGRQAGSYQLEVSAAPCNCHYGHASYLAQGYVLTLSAAGQTDQLTVRFSQLIDMLHTGQNTLFHDALNGEDSHDSSIQRFPIYGTIDYNKDINADGIPDATIIPNGLSSVLPRVDAGGFDVDGFPYHQNQWLNGKAVISNPEVATFWGLTYDEQTDTYALPYIEYGPEAYNDRKIV